MTSRRPSYDGDDPSVIRVSRTLRIRFAADGSSVAQVRTGALVIVFVGCAPLPAESCTAIAQVWWGERSHAACHGIGVDTEGAGLPPRYKFKVSEVADGSTAMRITASTAAGRVTVPSAGQPGARIHPDDADQCAAVASALIASAIRLHGSEAASLAVPSAAELDGLAATFRLPHDPSGGRP